MMNLRMVNGKKAEQMVNSYDTTPNTQYALYHVYKTVSENKMRAYENCLRLCNELNGHNFKICSYNTFAFTFAFRYLEQETGKEMLCYMTSNNTYSMEYK